MGKKRKGNYGHPIDEETRKRISETVKNRWKQKDYREKVTNAHMHKLDDKWKENISKARTGKKASEETKIRMSIAQSNKSKYTLEKQAENWKKQWNSLTKEQQLKRLEKWIEAGHKACRDGDYLIPSSIELKVKAQLDELGIKYVQQKWVNDGKRNYALDFYIPSLKLVIECNGDYWHSFPDKIERDKSLEKYVKSTGRNIVFIWEHEINDDWFCIEDYLKGGDAK